MDGLLKFGGAHSFNGPVYDLLLRGLDWPRKWCALFVASGVGVILLWRWLWA